MTSSRGWTRKPCSASSSSARPIFHKTQKVAEVLAYQDHPQRLAARVDHSRRISKANLAKLPSAERTVASARPPSVEMLKSRVAASIGPPVPGWRSRRAPRGGRRRGRRGVRRATLLADRQADFLGGKRGPSFPAREGRARSTPASPTGTVNPVSSVTVSTQVSGTIKDLPTGSRRATSRGWIRTCFGPRSGAPGSRRPRPTSRSAPASRC